MASEYQQMEIDAHNKFIGKQPTQEQLSSYLQKRIEITNLIDPVTISIAALAVSTAALMLQGWQTYQAGIPRCPECGRPADKTREDGSYECIRGHQW